MDFSVGTALDPLSRKWLRRVRPAGMFREMDPKKSEKNTARPWSAIGNIEAEGGRPVRAKGSSMDSLVEPKRGRRT